jgi:putative transposase
VETISLKVELLKPTEHKKKMYRQMTEINTSFANWLLYYNELNSATSRHFKLYSTQTFPSAIINQTIRLVKSKKKYQHAKVFRSFWCSFNNQNFKIEKENGLYKVSFPTLEKRIGVPVIAEAYQQHWLDKVLNGEAKKGTAELYEKNGHWYFSIAISFEVIKPKVEEALKPKTMGIDLGLNYLAVAAVGTNSLFFKGGEAAYIRRRFAARRRTLGKSKKMDVIKGLKDKESRWMKDVNHKISRQIIKFALSNGVCLIRMEDLTGIRHSVKSKKEAGRNLHSWAHYQLQKFIEYKAKIVGIEVQYVNPQNTSKMCKCGHVHKNNRNGQFFKCKKCGYKNHADLNASINISKAISGLSKKKKHKAS